jgi:hypothetical protein
MMDSCMMRRGGVRNEMRRVGVWLLVGCLGGGCVSDPPPPDDPQVAKLADRVAAGDDLTGVGYGLAHSDDPSAAVRVYVAVGRYLLGRLESYSGAERQRVEVFLSDGGAGDPLPSFSAVAARERLDRIEAQLGTRKP